MKYWAHVVVLLVAGTAFAQAPDASTDANPEVERLKAKAAEMKDHDRGKVYSEIARELAEDANRQYSSGSREQAIATVKDVVDYAEKAAESAKLKNKKTKDTEINIRKTARRLEEIEKTLAVEDRPPVRSAVDRLDTIRKDLLEFFLKRG